MAVDPVDFESREFSWDELVSFHSAVERINAVVTVRPFTLYGAAPGYAYQATDNNTGQVFYGVADEFGNVKLTARTDG